MIGNMKTGVGVAGALGMKEITANIVPTLYCATTFIDNPLFEREESGEERKERVRNERVE